MNREVIGYASDEQEALVAEVDLNPARLAQLRALLDPGDDVDLIDVYPLQGPALRLVAGWLSEPLPQGLDFFLETSV